MRIKRKIGNRKIKKSFFFSMPDSQLQNKGLWDALAGVVSSLNIGDIISNDDVREQIKKELGGQVLWSNNTFYSYTNLLSKCCIIEKLGKKKQFGNCGGFQVLRRIDRNIRHKDIKRLQAIPTWMNWFSDPEEIITRKSIRHLHEKYKG